MRREADLVLSSPQHQLLFVQYAWWRKHAWCWSFPGATGKISAELLGHEQLWHAAIDAARRDLGDSVPLPKHPHVTYSIGASVHYVVEVEPAQLSLQFRGAGLRALQWLTPQEALRARGEGQLELHPRARALCLFLLDS